MSKLKQNCIAFLQKKLPMAMVLDSESSATDTTNGNAKIIWPMVAMDLDSGVKHRAIVIENLEVDDVFLGYFSRHLDMIFGDVTQGLYVEAGNPLNPTGHGINTDQMTFAPRLVLYTNKLCSPVHDVLNVFSAVNTLVEIVDESKMPKSPSEPHYKTLFISYGGEDEGAAGILNTALKARGVETWFFPIDKPAGKRLHRVMHEGVNNHDRVLLVCSESALSRPGVLNEIEQILDREAREGGAEILIPITLDDYVYKWQPERPDIAKQVRSRVIVKIDVADTKSLESGVAKILTALE